MSWSMVTLTFVSNLLALMPAGSGNKPVSDDADRTNVYEVAYGSAEDEAAREMASGPQQRALAPDRLTVFDGVTFYDGYAGTVSNPVPRGVIRLRNDLYTRKLTPSELGRIQNTLTAELRVKALCDNYDRLGHIYLAFVPEGSATYDPANVTRVEIARLVTPFMDKNRSPNIVPFSWDVSDVVSLLRDPALIQGNEVWVELSIFGVPYAANTQIAGCAGRNDTSQGFLDFITDQTQPAPGFTFTIPIAVNEAFNNYNANATDTLGLTRKTRMFTLGAATKETQLVLITSNHGANRGGEEYNRRMHYVYIDGNLVHQYKPGRATCEPFRKWNTQANGIYGRSPRSPQEWQSFSNWCPGDIIDIRTIQLGPMSAGVHEFVLEVPDAVFVNRQGDIPFSLYIQGR